MWYVVCGMRYEEWVYDILGMRETGLTLREDPITISRSACEEGK